MDRRDFLKVGGAAAMAGVGTSAAQASGLSAPAILPDATELTLAAPGQPDVPGFGPDRLMRRIEQATGGRFRITMIADTASADLLFGATGHQRALHPAFAFFAGLPLSQGLHATTMHTWLVVGGGQMLWDDLAAQHGFKPMLARYESAGSGLWSSRRLDTVADIAGARLHADGLAADLASRLGAEPVRLDATELKASLAEGRIAAAEWAGPLQFASRDMQPLAERLYHPGLNAHGTMLSLDVRKDAWDRLAASDQAMFEACAAEAYQVSLAEAQIHALMTRQIEVPAKWPLRQTFGRELSAALEQAARELVTEIIDRDAGSWRILDSQQGFRRMLGEAHIA